MCLRVGLVKEGPEAAGRGGVLGTQKGYGLRPRIPPDTGLTRSGIVWSSPGMVIKHSYLKGLETVDSSRHSDTMGGVRFRKVKESQ